MLTCRFGLRLFNSPKYADLTISCQGHEWQVHRAIVCFRCPFFAACVDRDFKVSAYADIVLKDADVSIQEAQSGRIDLPDDDPRAIKLFLRYLYSVNLYSAQRSEPQTTRFSPEGLNMLFTLFEIASKYGAAELKTQIIKDLILRVSSYDRMKDHVWPPKPRETCQSIMSANEFFVSRGNLIKMAYNCDVPGIELFRAQIVRELQTGWLPDLMKLEGMLDILRECGQLGIDLLVGQMSSVKA